MRSHWLGTEKFDPAEYQSLLPTGAGTDKQNAEEVRT